jgi:hypothetical protein
MGGRKSGREFVIVWAGLSVARQVDVMLIGRPVFTEWDGKRCGVAAYCTAKVRYALSRKALALAQVRHDS